ncbi:MAG: hypothetical protein FMNOHCHN_03721 [Ignavibacteriaceae bacterium]|nr:hypothetical protein [Ignavibacteriaceae bacterium]
MKPKIDLDNLTEQDIAEIKAKKLAATEQRPDMPAKVKRTVTQKPAIPKTYLDKIRTGDLENVVYEAVAAIAIEVNRYMIKVSKGSSLDLKEARILQGYAKCLVELRREQRERERAEKLEDLTDEQLIDLAKKIGMHAESITPLTKEEYNSEDEED